MSVGRYPPNKYGLFDMAGNVWEFVVDLYSYSYDQGPASHDRVRRGGSWVDYPNLLRVSNRFFDVAEAYRDYVLGVRCARDVS